MKQLTSPTNFLTALSILTLTGSLSACSSLPDLWNGASSNVVTLPSQMSRTFPELKQREVAFPIEMTPAQSKRQEIPQPITVLPVDVEIFERGPSFSGYQAVRFAQDKALMSPKSENYFNAVQLYPYSEGALYEVYTSPAQITDITLQEGEELITVSAGDTQDWIVGDTVSGSGATEQVHILIKPSGENLSTNLIITTTKRSYYLVLKSSREIYMAAVAWRYPQDFLKTIFQPKPESPHVIPASFKKPHLTFNPDELRFIYRIKGDSPNWRPTRVFDDGKKVFIHFPEGLAVSEAPPLFVTDKKKKQKRLVNYRVKDGYYIVDRLFDFAELRIGEKTQVVVRIERIS